MRAGICGLGLIGGSLARALNAAGWRTSGWDVDPTARELARAAGLETVASTRDLFEADVIVLAAPLPALPELLPALSGYRGLLTDAVSVKGPPAALAAELCPGVRFVGGHPMAGKEDSGFAASDPELFTGRTWALCLEPEVSLADWTLAAAPALAAGALVLPTRAAEHDEAVARISHLPHLIAAAVTRLAASPLDRALAAGSFADGTRVAGSRPELTAAMCAGNAAAVRSAATDFAAELERLRRALDRGEAALAEALTPARRLRRGLPTRLAPGGTLPVEREALLALGREGGLVSGLNSADATATTARPVAPIP